jgi:hypothetical protein
MAGALLGKRFLEGQYRRMYFHTEVHIKIVSKQFNLSEETV